MAVRVVTDSTAGLSPQLLREHGVAAASLQVILGPEVTREVETSLDDLFRRMRETGFFPTSSQPPVPELVDLLETPVREGHDVAGFFISSAMSGTYAAALQARDQVLDRHPQARIEIVDSQTVTVELAVVVLAAARAAAAGADLERVLAVGRAAMTGARFFFVPSTLEHLRRGGRIGNAAALVGSLLQITPILSVEDGKVMAWRKVRTQRRAIQQIVDEFRADADAHIVGEDVFAVHSEAEEQGRALAATLAGIIGREVPLLPVSPVVAVHAGPGAVGIGYSTEPTRSLA